MSGKKTEESSSSSKNKSKVESLDPIPNPNKSEYESMVEFGLHMSEPEDKPRNEMANIEEMSVGAYKKTIREEVGPGLVQPTILATATFELK